MRAGEDGSSAPLRIAASAAHAPPATGARSSEREHRRTEAGAPAARATPAAKQAPTAQPAEPAAGRVPSEARAAARRARAGTHVPRGRRVTSRSTRCELEESRGKFPRPALASGSCCASAQLRHPDGWGLSPPAGSSGNRAGKVAGARAADFPPSLVGKRKVSPHVPETLDSPHRAEPARSRSLLHARAGPGRAPQQSARGGRGASLPRPLRGLPAAQKLLLPPPAFFSPPLGLPSQRMSPESCSSLRCPWPERQNGTAEAWGAQIGAASGGL